MSRLNDLLRQVANTDPQLAKDLRRETDALADRRAFGLNFERHTPEAVELPGRPVRKNDKVRILPERGHSATKEHERLFRVGKIYSADGDRWADVVAVDDPGYARSVKVADLVVVAEFRDPIYPGLVSTGKVECGGDKPFHSVINAENYHALQALLFTHRGKVDAIYIDPPYNTRANDWKYNNDYVNEDDYYRHSKWLAFMERRLLLAQELLRPEGSVLIVAIDDNEVSRLGLLLEQVFPGCPLVPVTVVMNPKGTPENGFARIDETLYFVLIGDCQPDKVLDSLHGQLPSTTSLRVRWRGLTRTGANGTRAKSPGAYYPIYLRKSDGSIHSAGEVPPADSDGRDVVPPEGTVAVWPTPRPDGTLGRWSVVKSKFEALLAIGAVKPGKVNFERGDFPLWYLTDPNLKSIEEGDIVVRGHDEQGSMIVEYADAASKKTTINTVWSRASHSASEYGSDLLASFVPGRPFPYPKSLYAVEDALRPFIGRNPNAVVVDFFSGSGTTAHAVMRLNAEDDGRRVSISVTNNEASADEVAALVKAGRRPMDPEWEALGICEYITKPRIRAAVTGVTHAGTPVAGSYKYGEEGDFSDGLAENVEFFTLTYESAMRVSSHREFPRIAPFLWLRAGARGRRIDDISTGWDVADVYGVIANLDLSEQFIKAVEAQEGLTHAFIVTDEDRLFEAMVRQLPEYIEPVRLYASYLRNFEIEAGRAAAR